MYRDEGGDCRGVIPLRTAFLLKALTCRGVSSCRIGRQHYVGASSWFESSMKARAGRSAHSERHPLIARIGYTGKCVGMPDRTMPQINSGRQVGNFLWENGCTCTFETLALLTTKGHDAASHR